MLLLRMTFLCGYNFRVCWRAGWQLINAVECRRFYSRNSPSKFAFGKRDEQRMERFMKKTADLVAGNKKKQTNLNSVHNILKSLEADPSDQLKTKLNNKIVNNLPKCTSPRMKQLSSVFASNLINLFQSREVGSDLTELGFEMTDVTVAPRAAYVVISWTAINEANVPQIMELIPKSSSSIRYALRETRVIANVPPIMFHRDTTQSRLEDINYLLSIADVGPAKESCTETEEVSEEEEQSSEWSKVYGIDYEQFKNELMMSKQKIPNKILVESAVDKKTVEIHVEKV